MATWEYRNDGGDFVRFRKEQADAVERAWQTRGCHKTALKIGSQSYTVDFDRLVQINDGTGTERFLRRKGVAGEVHARAVVWEWHDKKHKKWVPYLPDANHQIEKAFNADELHCTISVPVSAHDTINATVHFGHMHQRNTDSGTTRDVRRTTSVVLEDVHVAGRRARSPDGAAASAGPAAPAMSSAAAAAAANKQSAATAPPAPPPPPPQRAAALRMSDWKTVDGSVLWLNAEPGVTKRGATLKVAAFDMDDTLIVTKSGKTFAQNALDWKWIAPVVVPKLLEAAQQGYTLVIFSNQLGVRNDPSKRVQLSEKILSLNAALGGGAPLYAALSIADDERRKPSVGMWTLLCEQLQASQGATVDVASSFYVGDAAGRRVATMAGRDKDFSCSDRKFAYNVGLRFMTPECFFLGKSDAGVPFDWEGVGPDEIAAITNSSNAATKATPAVAAAAGNDLVVMVGFPGSGKSTYYREHFAPHGYVHINRDTLKTPAKCLAAAEAALNAKQRVCVDNTNGGAEDRKVWVALAKKMKVAPRALWMRTSEPMSKHLDHFRSHACGGPHVPGIAYAVFKKKFEPPTLAEGFTEVIEGHVRIDTSKLTDAQRTVLLNLT